MTLAELTDVDPEDLRTAFAICRRECKFFPKPVDIFEMLKKHNGSMAGMKFINSGDDGK